MLARTHRLGNYKDHIELALGLIAEIKLWKKQRCYVFFF